MKKVIVIGAGISGLSAAIYAQRSGFNVTICDQHSMAGGMCTSWKRSGYLFEGAVHWLTGSSPKTKLNTVWKETGALNDDVPIILQEQFHALDWNGKTINLYRDIDKTAQILLELSPEDGPQIRRLVKDVKAFSGFQMPVVDIKGVKAQNPKRFEAGSLLKMLPALPKLPGLSNISCHDYLQKFKHPAIRMLLGIVPDGYNALSLIFTLSSLNFGDGGYPEGGSLAMIKRMVGTFEQLGGTLMLNTRVKRVRIENNIAGESARAATGVMLENGTALDADAVIVTQETIAAHERLFETPPGDKWLTELKKNTKPEVCTFIGMGIRCELPKPIVPLWVLDEPIRYAGRTQETLGFYNNANLENYAPKNCSVLTTSFIGDTFEFWYKAKKEGRYEEEKEALANQIKLALCKKYPVAEGNIEVIDIATPLTYERYTGAYHGSWMSITGAGSRMTIYPGFSKELSGLYFAGHRIMPPGGLPTAVFTGRNAAQMVCRQFDMVFK